MRLVAAVLAVSLAGCPSPVNDDDVAALGGECPGVPESEFHRPGQPCVVCHGEYESDSPLLSIGGTVFGLKDAKSPTPVEGAIVILTDGAGQTRTKATNCIGNFMFTEDEWTPVFPIHAEIDCPLPDDPAKFRRVSMGTRITRDGSCAGCHFGRQTLDSPGWIYCSEQGEDYSVSSTCPGICKQ